jgi:hypothetical protein
MSDDQTSTLDAAAPAPPPSYDPAYAGTPAAPPRFVDRVLGMRAVIAVALAALIIGGLSGFVLGERTGGADGRFGHGGPGGFPGGQGFRGGPPQMQGQPGQQQFGQGQGAP